MKRYLIFAAISPFIGGFLLLLTTTYQSGYWTETSSGEVGKLFAVFAKSLPFSYIIGIVPALMFAAIDDILMHVRRISPVVRMLMIGAVAFVVAVLTYASHGSDSGALQIILYGLVGFVPGVISSWAAHKYAEEPHPAVTPAQR
ncbi:DUF5413 family protein [Bradyrhizobium lablabi]|uniref:DUF5413 family protein n=1 Tax=Bradyrhizobium lablabi TaxID=722472 RepID=UPI001BAD8371|nr:DUF5413 family protein [Bradyrhizobium lablabi]MBR0696903.1 DUF5413 family protein [Bradyrhizobium lablabi]